MPKEALGLGVEDDWEVCLGMVGSSRAPVEALIPSKNKQNRCK